MRLFDQNIWGNYGPNDTVGNRCRLVYEEIRRLQPDICCFQECNPNSVRLGELGIDRLMQAEYQELCPERAGENFTPVFLKKGVFDVLEEGFLPYPGLNDLNSKSVTYGVLRHRASGKTFAVASTHFWWQRGEESDRQREDNARVLGDLAGRLCGQYHVPFLVSGDFNSGLPPLAQGLAGYEKMLTLGFRDARLTSENTTDTLTARADYPLRQPDDTYTGGTMPTFTIDYIFTYGDGLSAKRFDVLTTPNALNSSDHCPLVLDFEVG